MAHFFNIAVSHKWMTIIVMLLFIGGIIGILQTIVTPQDQSSLLISERDVVQYVQLSGEMTAEEVTELAFSAMGKVAAIEVEQGESVQVGEVLARLESAHLDAELTQARANAAVAEAKAVAANASLQKAESNLALVRAQNRGISASVDSAHTALSITQSEQATLVANAYQELLNNDLQAYQTDAHRTLSNPLISGNYRSDEPGEYRIKFYRSGAGTGYSLNYSGVESGTIAINDYGLPVELGTRGLFIALPVAGEGDSYGTSEWLVSLPNTRSVSYESKFSLYEEALETQKQSVSQAEANLVNLLAQQAVGEQVSITTAQDMQAQAAVAEAGANLKQMQASLDQAKAQEAVVEAQLADTVITAPFAGIIAKINLNIGETIGTVVPVITMVSDKGYKLRMNVPELDIAKINIGSGAVMYLDAYGEAISWPGVVSEIELIETEVDGVPVYVSTITLNDMDKRFRVGMNARARISVQTAPQVAAVPASYILFTEESAFVFVRNGNKSEKREITLGLRGTDNYYAVTGLEAGEYIVKPPEK